MRSIFYNFLVFIALLLTACSTKNKPVIVTFSGNLSEKKWAIKELNSDLPSDWSLFEFLTFEFNSSTTQRFDLRIYDAEGIRRLSIHPLQGTWVRASIPLIHFQKRNTKGMDMAAIGKTARPGYWIGFSGQTSHQQDDLTVKIIIQDFLMLPTVHTRRWLILQGKLLKDFFIFTSGRNNQLTEKLLLNKQVYC